MSTVAGNASYGYSGDNGPATSATFMEMSGITFDHCGQMYVADESVNVIRKVDFANNNIIGDLTICTEKTSRLRGCTSGGTWSSGNTSIVIIDPVTGVTAGVSAGSAIITYSVSGSDLTVTLTVLSCIPVPERLDKKDIGTNMVISPNPSSGCFSFKLSSGYNESAKIIIYNSIGQKVTETATDTNKEIKVKTELIPGIYFLTANSEHTINNTKIVVR